MKRKLISIALVTALVMVSFVGASLAYFQDQETVTNTFTMGDVDIAIVEKDKNNNDVGSDLGTGEGMSFERVLPGVEMDKAPFIKVKEVSVPSYIAAKVTVNNATNFIARTGSAWDLFDEIFVGGLADAAKTDATLLFKGEDAVGYEVSSTAGTGKVFLMVNVDDALDVIEYYFVYEEAQEPTSATAAKDLDKLFEKVVIPTTLKQSDVPADKKITVKIDAYAIQRDGFTPDITNNFANLALAGLAEVSGVAEPVSNNKAAALASTAAELKAALTNTENAIVTLTEDVVLDKQIVVAGTTVLNLDGHTISNTEDIWDDATYSWSLISVQGADADLTIKGGTFAAKANDNFAVDVRDGATVTIEDGIFVGNIHAVYVEEGIANIKGGTYSVQQKYNATTPDGYVINLLDANRTNGTAKAYVTGGTFVGFNPADCPAEGAHTNFVVAGYHSVDNADGTWSVVAD